MEPPLLSAAREHGAELLRAVPRPGPCRVWELGGRRRLWIKRFASGRAFEQERRALKDWGLNGVPEIVAEGPRSLLLSHVEGGQVEGIEGWRAAGAFLRRLQEESGPDVDAMPLSDALSARLASWTRRGAGRLPSELLDSVHAGFQPEAFAGDLRTRCHRDYQPQNWLWAPAGLGVIDFEHARWDHPLTDLVRVLDHVELDQPRAQAFLSGWGRSLDERDQARLRSLRLLHALGSAAWAGGAVEG